MLVFNVVVAVARLVAAAVADIYIYIYIYIYICHLQLRFCKAASCTKKAGDLVIIDSSLHFFSSLLNRLPRKRNEISQTINRNKLSKRTDYCTPAESLATTVTAILLLLLLLLLLPLRL